MGNGSFDKGKRDGAKGGKEYVEYALNPDYRAGYDYGEGLKKGSESVKDSPLISGVVEGFEKAGQSEHFKRGYDRGKETYGRDTSLDKPLQSGRGAGGGAGGGGGGGGVSSSPFGEEWLVGSIGIGFIAILAILICLWASVLLWCGLFAMCFVLIFTKPLRGILGFGIAALSLYLAVQIGMESEGGGLSGAPLGIWIACTFLIWLAPLMALAKKPLYVFLAFVLFGALAALLFLGIPYLGDHPEVLYYLDDQGPGIGILLALGGIFGCIVLLIIGIVIPIYLTAEAFSGTEQGTYGTTIGFPSWAVRFLGLVIFVVLATLSTVGFFAPKYLDQKTDEVIKRFYPTYETKEERILEEKQEWERWEHFTQSSEKWLAVSETAPLVPQGELIFLSRRNGGRDICSVDLRSGKQVNLTSRFAGEVTSFASSPDGKKIAFVAARKGKNSEIYLMDSNRTNVAINITITQVTKTTDGLGYGELVWLSPLLLLVARQTHLYTTTIWQVELSSDPKVPAIVYLEVPTYQEYNDTWVRMASARGPTTYFNCGYPSVSPNGEELAYIKGKYSGFDQIPGLITKGESKLVVGSRRSSRGSKKFAVYPVHLTSQAWSPEGDRIVFTGALLLNKRRENRLGILELSKESWWSSSKVTWFRILGNNPAWSPDGNWITLDYEGTIYALEVASGNVRKIAGPTFSGQSGEKPLWVSAPW